MNVYVDVLKGWYDIWSSRFLMYNIKNHRVRRGTCHGMYSVRELCLYTTDCRTYTRTTQEKLIFGPYFLMSRLWRLLLVIGRVGRSVRSKTSTPLSSLSDSKLLYQILIEVIVLGILINLRISPRPWFSWKISTTWGLLVGG